jgi:hypothetical protein
MKIIKIIEKRGPNESTLLLFFGVFEFLEFHPSTWAQ